MTIFVRLNTDRPVANRMDIWSSTLKIKSLSPTRMDKLVTLLDLVGFVLKDIDSPDGVITGEIRDSLEGYKVKVQ